MRRSKCDIGAFVKNSNCCGRGSSFLEKEPTQECIRYHRDDTPNFCQDSPNSVNSGKLVSVKLQFLFCLFRALICLISFAL